MSWTADEIAAGRMDVVRDGRPATVTWQDAAADPGWCKLDLIVSDPARGALAYASNVLDVTWEAPDGAIVALDGFIDLYFQEVYLESGSLPLLRRLVEELSADAVDEYAEQIEGEIRKYLTGDPNYGKVARRLYNVFRLTARYAEAACVRELFDEPTTVLYQVATLVQALEGREVVEMVRRLLEAREALAARRDSVERSARADEVTSDALVAMNGSFEQRLRAVPGIAAYLDGLAAGA